MKRTREQIGEKMHTSNMHDRVDNAVTHMGIIPTYFNYEIILKEPEPPHVKPLATYPDWFFPQKDNLCIYLDGPAHELGKQRERDEELREMLRALGYKVKVIKYEHDSNEEFIRIMKEFRSALE